MPRNQSIPKEQITEGLDAATKLTSQGHYDEALKKLNSIRSMMEDNQLANHPNAALVTGAMAVVFWMLGDHKKASDQYAQALDILETQLESDDLRLANLLETGGGSIVSMGNWIMQRHCLNNLYLSTN